MNDKTEISASVGREFRQNVRTHFKGNHQPATVEMIADLWAHMTLLQDCMISIASIIGPSADASRKNAGFIELANNLQESLDTLTKRLNSLPEGTIDGH